MLRLYAVTFPAFPCAEESILPTVILPVASRKTLPPLAPEVLISPAKILVPAFTVILPPLFGEVVSRLPVLISPLSLSKEIPAAEVIFLEVILFVVVMLISVELLVISSSILMLFRAVPLPTAPPNCTIPAFG